MRQNLRNKILRILFSRVCTFSPELIQFAAQMAYHLNILRLKVADGSLPQDNIRGKQPLCASAYKYLFNTCRIPAPESDVIGMYDAKKFHHMVVLY